MQALGPIPLRLRRLLYLRNPENSENMDPWIKSCLGEWEDIPLPADTSRFILEVFAELKGVRCEHESSTVMPLMTPTPRHKIVAAASSIAARISSQPDKKADELLQKYQGIIFDAAFSSKDPPLSTKDIAEITNLIVNDERISFHRRRQFQIDLTWGASEDCDDLFLDCWDHEEDTRSRSQVIQDWISYNEVCAHLAQTNTAVSMEKLGAKILSESFEACASAPDLNDVIDFHVPAAAVWIWVLGKEIYRWCMNSNPNDRALDVCFTEDKWYMWQNSFEDYWDNSETSHMWVKFMAESAWGIMCDLENGIEI